MNIMSFIAGNRKSLLSIFCSLVVCSNILAQEVGFNMTREAFVDVFGTPDSESKSDFVFDGRQLLFYDDDCFTFCENKLVGISLCSDRISFDIFGDMPLVVGSRFSTFRERAKYQFEHKMTLGDSESYGCALEDSGIDVNITVSGDIITGCTINRDTCKEPFKKRDFRIFFDYSYKPEVKYGSDGAIVIPNNSVWPAGLNVKWKKLNAQLSRDKVSATCCVPFVAQLQPSATYSGKKCHQVAQRLVITEMLDGSNMFKQRIMSVIPVPGLKPGDNFTGLILYSNVNTSSAFAWENYENGRLVYSKYPSKKSGGSTVSSVNLGIRFAQKLVYTGGESAISDTDWLIIAANRLDMTEAYPHMFAPGRSEEAVKSERNKYSFASLPNDEYRSSRSIDIEDMDKIARTAETVAPATRKTPAKAAFTLTSHTPSDKQNVTDKVEPSKYMGKSNNLRDITTVDKSLVKIGVESVNNARNDGSVKHNLVGENSDYCNYTMRMPTGEIFDIMPGRNLLSNGYLKFRYFIYKGKLISNIDIRFPYLLPAAPGRKVKLIVDERERYRSFALLMNYGEPVYAMRAGYVCCVKEQGNLLISHKDETFAAYMNLENCCVSPGDKVIPGELIGYCGGGKLSISIFYLDANKMGNESGYPYTHLTPYIHTENGDEKLEVGKEYVVCSDSEIITKEMRSAQKKKYLKNISK